MRKKSWLLQHILSATCDVLGLDRDEVSGDSALSEVGFDSISLGHFARIIAEKTGVTLDPLMFLQRETLAELAAEVAKSMPDRPNDREIQKVPTTTWSHSEIERRLIELAALATGAIDIEIESGRALSDYGFDSIKLAEFAASIENTFRIKLEPVAFLQYGSIGALVLHLEFRLNEKDAKTKALGRNAGDNTVSLPDTEKVGPGREAADPKEAGRLAGTPEAVVSSAAAEPQEASSPLRACPSSTAPSGVELAGDGRVAVIGIAARLPGCKNIADFWRLLMTQSSVIQRVPPSRWRWEDFDGQPGTNRTDCHYGTFIEDLEFFDAKLFGISNEEALYLDPQSRLLFEVCHELIETAGYGSDMLRGKRVAALIGVQRQEFMARVIAQNGTFATEVESGSLQGFMINRLGHYFDWRGPTCAVNSACASSSIAIHLAVQALRAGDAEVAVAGGVNFVMSPLASIAERQQGSFTPECEVRSFDANANGIVIGDGCGLILLKPMEKAIADGDHIYGTILSTAVANSGRSIYSLAPNPEGHARVVREALSRAKLDPDEIDYVEAQGAATGIADQAELKAYHSVFSATRSPLRITNLKANIGHLETASGVVSVIKTLLSMNSGWVPGVRNVRKLNWGEPGVAPIEIVLENEPWRCQRQDRKTAAVHNFGAGGSHAHVILESHTSALLPEHQGPSLCIFSAPSQEQLRAYLRRLHDFIRDREFLLHGVRQLHIKDIAHTLAQRRKHHPVRHAVVVDSVGALVSLLSETLSSDTAPKQGSLICARGLHHSELSERARRWLDGDKVDRIAASGRVIPLPGIIFNKERFWPFEENAGNQAGVPADALPVRATDGEMRLPGGEPSDDSIMDSVHVIASNVLGRDRAQLDIDQPLGYLGFESLSLKLFASRLSEYFGATLQPVKLFEYPTLRALAKYLKQEAKVVVVPASNSKPAELERADKLDRAVAVVGLAARLPGARSKEEFWQNQLKKANCIVEVPDDRWKWNEFEGNPRRDVGKTNSKWGGFITDIDQFSPGEFGISQYEAELMDPQHRLFLKTAWEAIWDAGYHPSSLNGRSVGVFVGVQFQEYQDLLVKAGLLLGQTCTGNAHAMLPNRLSYILNLRGPSEAVDTACSSSFVALHNAVRALQSGDCESAIVGGVNLMLTPDLHIMGSELGVLSPTGQCRTLDAEADGYVRSEGVVAVLLKPLASALAQRDHIYGIIRGTAVNHGGKATSLTAPNVQAQSELMISAIRSAAVRVDEISYVELHGTGTELGDPIEVEAVKKAFQHLQGKEEASVETGCSLGSVKANIGHLEAAAGVSGLVNVLMAMKHQTLPGLSNFVRKNDYIELRSAGFSIQSDTAPWISKSLHRTAVINSFGFGGTNASVVVTEAVVRERVRNALPGDVLVPIAAANRELLRAYANSISRALDAIESGEEPQVVLRDVAFTLQQRTGASDARAVAKVSSLDELKMVFDALGQDRELPANLATREKRLGEWPSNAIQWLQTGAAEWADDGLSHRRALPTPPWPDRRCWFLNPIQQNGREVKIGKNDVVRGDILREVDESAASDLDLAAVNQLSDDEVATIAARWLGWEDNSDYANAPLDVAEENDLDASPDTPDDSIAQQLSAHLRRLLKGDAIAAGSQLRHLGIDSIVAPRMAEELGHVFKIEIPPSWLTEAGSVGQLASQISIRKRTNAHAVVGLKESMSEAKL